MEQLKTLLQSYGSMSDGEFSQFAQSIKRQSLKRGDHFLMAGDTNRWLGFIERGLLRVYSSNGEEDTTYYFLKEGQFAIDLDSFFHQKPSDLNIQALEDCRIWRIGYDSLQEANRYIPELERITGKLVEHFLIAKLNDRNPLVSETARARYEKLLREHPDIIARAPLGHIASYLGITPQSLSRLRRQLARV
jgi:CRP-like cAMP-binding protein